jgi:hypothetical protein
MELRDVWFAPTSPYNMMSLNRLEELGVAYDWKTRSLMWTKSEWILASVDSWNGIKVVRLDLEKVSSLKNDETRMAFLTVDFRVLHRRLMHAGYDRTVKAAERAGIRLSNKPTGRFHCEACELAKSRLIVSREAPTPAQRPFERVHFDLIEYEKGWGDKRWALHFLCAYSNYHWIRTLSSKREIWSAVVEWLDFIKNQTALQPQIIHIDGFREIIDRLQKLCAERGIALNVTVPYTPDPNGKVERAGKTLNTNARARATCIDVGLAGVLV